MADNKYKVNSVLHAQLVEIKGPHGRMKVRLDDEVAEEVAKSLKEGKEVFLTQGKDGSYSLV